MAVFTAPRKISEDDTFFLRCFQFFRELGGEALCETGGANAGCFYKHSGARAGFRFHDTRPFLAYCSADGNS